MFPPIRMLMLVPFCFLVACELREQDSSDCVCGFRGFTQESSQIEIANNSRISTGSHRINKILKPQIQREECIVAYTDKTPSQREV